MADTTTILNRLISALTSQDPTWDVVPGTAEYKILEAVAQELNVAINNNTIQNYSFDITTKSGSNLDDFCALFGIFRSQGKRASGNATFSTTTTGLTGGLLTINNATTGSFSATYNGNTVSSLAYNISATDLQTQLRTIVPSSSSVTVAYTSPSYTITISPALPLALTFDFGTVDGITSWGPYGGATANYEIPLGTQIYAPSAATGTVPIYYQTTASAMLPQYGTQVQVPIQSVLTGTNNNLSAGTISALATALPGITQVTNSALTGGSDAETDDQLRQRWQNTVFKNLSGTEDQFRALALSNPGTSRVKVLGPQEQNVEDLQIQTTFKVASKYDGTLQPSTNINSTDTFNLYLQSSTNATWTVDTTAGGGTSSVVTFTIPSGQNIDGIYPGMNVYSFSYPISITYGLVVKTFNANSDGSATVVAIQTNGANQTLTASGSIAYPVTFAVPVKSTGSFDGTTTIDSLQTQLNNAVTGSVISDTNQIITITSKYNSGNLTINTNTGGYSINYVDSNGTTHTANVSSGFSTTSTLSTALNNVISYDGYKAFVTQGSSSNPYSYTIDFFTTNTAYPADISIINKNLTFNFASLNGSSPGGSWVVPTNNSGTIAQLASCNIQFSKPSKTDLVVIAGRIDSNATSGYPSTPTNIVDSNAILSDWQSSSFDYTYVYGCNIPANTYVSSLTGSGPVSYTGYVLSNSSTNGLGGAGIQLVFTGANNPYAITNSIKTSVIDAIYIYSQGIESLRSNLAAIPTQQTANPQNDYTYVVSSTISTTVTNVSATSYATYYTWNYTANNNFVAGQTVTISGLSPSAYNGTFTVFSANSTNFIVYGNSNPGPSSGTGIATGSTYASLTLNIKNSSNYSWLYPGNIPTLTYYAVLDASRNTPTDLGITSNYVDVIIDGATQQLINEDVVMNTTNTTNIFPGCSGVFNSTNRTKWVLGDKLTNPPAGDLFYIFSQQPVLQPWFGIYPQKLTLSQSGGLHTGLQAYSGPIGGTDPVVANVTTSTSSTTMTTGSRQMKPIYYKEWFYLPEAFTTTTPVGVASVSSYSQTDNTIVAKRSDSTINPDVAGTFPNVIFTSDIYPIYDNTTNQGSTQAINGIGIRQPDTHYKNVSCTTNSTTTVAYSGASNSDLGKLVSDNPPGTTTNIKNNSRIISVVPGVSFTMSRTANSSATVSLRITDFINTPTINTGDLIFGLQYYVDSDVVAVDNLIQQQRLVGVSTMTHLAKSNYFLINLVTVLSSSADISTVNSALNTQVSNYLNSLPFGQPVQASSIIRIALSISGVINARLATSSDNSSYYGIQEVTPYTYYTSIQEITQGGASSVDFRDILVKQTYPGDVILGADDLPILFRVNLYTRSQSDF